MTWFAICLPLMAVGVAIATVPLAFATHHQHRYGPHGSSPRLQEEQATPPSSRARTGANWTDVLTAPQWSWTKRSTTAPFTPPL